MNSALIVVDVQNDFCPGGSLAVAGGDEIIPLINELILDANIVIFTKDWHPEGHISFASSHPGEELFTQVLTHAGYQMMWPDHCVQNTHGSALHEGLDTKQADAVILKGQNKHYDSYSGFRDESDDYTELNPFLIRKGIKEVTVVGLALDYCVAATALDAARLGYEVTVRVDATRGVTAEGSEKAIEYMKNHGIIIEGILK